MLAPPSLIVWLRGYVTPLGCVSFQRTGYRWFGWASRGSAPRSSTARYAVKLSLGRPLRRMRYVEIGTGGENSKSSAVPSRIGETASPRLRHTSRWAAKEDPTAQGIRNARPAWRQRFLREVDPNNGLTRAGAGLRRAGKARQVYYQRLALGQREGPAAQGRRGRGLMPQTSNQAGGGPGLIIARIARGWRDLRCLQTLPHGTGTTAHCSAGCSVESTGPSRSAGAPSRTRSPTRSWRPGSGVRTPSSRPGRGRATSPAGHAGRSAAADERCAEVVLACRNHADALAWGWFE